MLDATFCVPDLTTFTRLDELGLVVVGQRLEPDRAVLACRVLEPELVLPTVWLPGRSARVDGPAAGSRAIRVAPDDARDHDPALPVHRWQVGLAPGHQHGN